MKIVFTADLHLDSAFVGEDRVSRNRELVAVFESICDHAQKIGAGALVIGGDLFDTPYPSSLTVGAVKKIISDRPKLKLYAVAGNHDPLYTTSFYAETPDNMYVFGEDVECVDLGGVRLYGASVTSSTDCRDIWQGINVEDGALLVCHGTVNGDGSAHRISRDAVERSGACLCLMGHIHKTTQYEWSGPCALYCGCPAGRGFDEQGVHGFYVVDTETKDIEYIKTDAKIYSEYSVDISDADDINGVMSRLLQYSPKQGEIARAVVVGEVSGEFAVDTDELCARTDFCEIKDKTTLALDVMKNADADTLEGEFIRILLSRLEGAEGEQKQKILDALKEGVTALRGAK